MLSEEDLNLLLDDQDAKSTKRATKSTLKVFHQYLKEKKTDEPQTKDTPLLRMFGTTTWWSVTKRTLGEKMKNISREAKLSKSCTNHSIRAIAVTILNK